MRQQRITFVQVRLGALSDVGLCRDHLVLRDDPVKPDIMGLDRSRFREFRTWKHYRGGMEDNVWIYDFKTEKTENLTNYPNAQNICPMWGPDNKVYFLSDRDNRMNLFSIDLASKETKQLTHFTDFDIKFPTIGPKSIVFEFADGQMKGPKRHGIYEVAGDQLKLCYGPVDRPKPVKFESPAKSGYFLETWAKKPQLPVRARD